VVFGRKRIRNKAKLLERTKKRDVKFVSTGVKENINILIVIT
jgi:hypothetical protein